MRLSKPALAVPAAFIILAVPVIDFPVTAAKALGGGLAIVAAVVSKMAAQDMMFLLVRDRLLSIATITDAAGNLTWRLNPDKAERLFRSEAALWCATTGGIAFAWAVLLGSYAVGIFYQASFLDSRPLNTKPSLLLLGFLVTSILLVACLTLLPKFQAHVKKHHFGALEARMQEMLPSLDKAMQELRKVQAVQNDIDIFRRDLGLRQHTTFVTKAASAIASSGPTAADNPSVITTAIRAVLSEAEGERGHLARATASYACATARVAQVRRNTDTLGAASLSQRILDLSHVLSSDQLKNLVAGRQWREFSEIMGLLVADLDALERQTGRFARGDTDSDKRPPAEDGAVSVDWACQVLKLPPTATKGEIKTAFRSLCTKWHPDTGRVTDDTEIKRITEAYHFLKKAKRFA